MITLKEVTKSSWLVLAADQKVALISKTNRGDYALLSKEGSLRFDNEEGLNQFFDTDIFGNISCEPYIEDVEYFISGYPVNYHTPIEVELEDITLPLFAKKKNTTVYFCAGYYCIHTNRGWKGAFCPKYSTVKKYEIKGPLKTEFEMKQVLKSLKKE